MKNYNDFNSKRVSSIFSRISPTAPDEVIEQLLANGSVRLERIVSTGQATPDGQWYDQEQSEWVLLLSGAAGLRFEGEEKLCILHSGDYIHIPAHQRHRVEWTDASQPTIWLALHYIDDSKPTN